MITLDQKSGLVSLVVMGEFTLEDFREFEDYLFDKGLFDGSCSLLFDLREMTGFTLDLAWEEIKFTRLHGGDFKRVAVVTDSQWVAWTAWLEQLFVSTDMRVFDEAEAAVGWLTPEAS